MRRPDRTRPLLAAPMTDCQSPTLPPQRPEAVIDRPTGITARCLMRACSTAALATVGRDGAPYNSLVEVGVDHQGAPVLLLSDLAEHTRNIRQDNRIGLLFDGTAGHHPPLAGPRVTVQGWANATAAQTASNRFLARHPDAARYAGFADFQFYRIKVDRAGLVAGFGRISRLRAGNSLVPVAVATALAEAEANMIAQATIHLGDRLQLYVRARTGYTGGTGAVISEIDCDGFAIRQGLALVRDTFPQPVRTPSDALTALWRVVGGLSHPVDMTTRAEANPAETVGRTVSYSD